MLFAGTALFLAITSLGDRPLADLYLSLLQRIGVCMDRIADRTGPLPKLTA